MDTLAIYAVIAVVVALALIPIGVLFAFVPFSIWGGLGKALLGRGGADDKEAVNLLHTYAPKDKNGFFAEDELNVPFSQQNKAG